MFQNSTNARTDRLIVLPEIRSAPRAKFHIAYRTDLEACSVSVWFMVGSFPALNCALRDEALHTGDGKEHAGTQTKERSGEIRY